MKFFKSLALSTVALVGFVAYTGTANADEINYTIQPNDTLSELSLKYFGSANYVNKIAEDNNIADPGMIYVGETLVINTNGEVATAAPAQQAPVEQAPAQEAVVEQAPVQQAPAQEAVVEQAAPATTYTSSASGNEAAAKEWIAQKESSGSYTATNGQYYGRYQLTNTYLNGDYSVENQERVADSYVQSRYGSWSAAQAFWMANGWY
ncbi:LysM peptidoglycan-binding domain-containing protein [uncultured Enterococcus sp.]|uniref:aggregation-promoting factor n=1 Tax=uncultured Enterococcus sp. TaxID=167972 RepID=UPI0025D6D2E3|nr:LysM peptidoglycan-binding domain-containing protein [uncultured Enterococcus sp.]